MRGRPASVDAGVSTTALATAGAVVTAPSLGALR